MCFGSAGGACRFTGPGANPPQTPPKASQAKLSATDAAESALSVIRDYSSLYIVYTYNWTLESYRVLTG